MIAVGELDEVLPEVAPPAPLEQFLRSMRRDTPAPRIRVR
jgi:hypothetical protein